MKSLADVVCDTCRHRVPPRSQRCDVDHPLCTPEGCTPEVPAPRLLAAAPQAAAGSTTVHMVDLAWPYQQGVSLPALWAAGYRRLNIKLSQGNWYRNPNAGPWIAEGLQLGFGISTFHWIDNSASGAEQAAIVLGLLQQFGIQFGTVHECDTEDTTRPPTWTIWRDYMTTLQAPAALARPVLCYTGDWWWEPTGWNGASVTPYVTGAPNHGYDTAYPGDDSPDWLANFGGWGPFAALQYTVSGVPNAGGGSLSKTAWRDPTVWPALTGVDAASTGEEDDVNPYLSKRDGNDTIYLSNKFESRPLTLQDLTDLIYEYDKGWLVLTTGGQGANDAEWAGVLGHDRIVRLGGYDGRDGAVRQPAVAPTDDQVNAAVAAVMNNPAWMAKLAELLPAAPSTADIATAVNDEAKVRRQG